MYHKFYGRTKDYAEDLVMPMYNLIGKHSNNFEMHEVYGFILKMKQLILMLILRTLIILNL